MDTCEARESCESSRPGAPGRTAASNPARLGAAVENSGDDQSGPPEVLDIDRDWVFYRRTAAAQRVGWAALALVILAALLGLFGPGLLGRAHADDGDLAVEWGRFARVQAPVDIRFTIDAHAIEDGAARLWIAQSWLGRVTVKSIRPRPVSTQAAGDRTIYTFSARPDASVEIVVRVSGDQGAFGPVEGEAGTMSGSRVRFKQWLWP